MVAMTTLVDSVEPWVDPTRWLETAPWVTPGMAAKAFNRPERTIREWARRGDVRSMCTIHPRLLLVWWPDVMDMNDQAQRRTRQRVA